MHFSHFPFRYEMDHYFLRFEVTLEKVNKFNTLSFVNVKKLNEFKHHTRESSTCAPVDKRTRSNTATEERGSLYLNAMRWDENETERSEIKDGFTQCWSSTKWMKWRAIYIYTSLTHTHQYQHKHNTHLFRGNRFVVQVLCISFEPLHTASWCCAVLSLLRRYKVIKNLLVLKWWKVSTRPSKYIFICVSF